MSQISQTGIHFKGDPGVAASYWRILTAYKANIACDDITRGIDYKYHNELFFLIIISPALIFYECIIFKMSTVSAIIPVMNECGNVSPILRRLDLIAGKCNLKEVIFVDGQSTDGTMEEIEKERSVHSFNVRAIMQEKRDGLVGAEILGARKATSDYVVILDGDMQHPPEIIADMWKRTGDTDIIVGSRYTEGGIVDRKPFRGVISRGAVALAHLLIPASRGLKDPISGFFMARKYLFDHISFISGGYETLLFILAWNPDASTSEVPYKFCERESGMSKIVDKTGRFLVNFVKQSFYCRKASAVSARLASKVGEPESAR